MIKENGYTFKAGNFIKMVFGLYLKKVYFKR